MKFEWRDSNGQAYLYVEADDHFELGVATGKGLVEQIKFITMILRQMAVKFGLDPEILYRASQEYLPTIPVKYVQEMRGMAQGATEASQEAVEFEDILLQSLLLEVIHGRLNLDMSLLQQPLEGCTCFGAINPDGSVSMGQNYDADDSVMGALAWVLSKVGDEPLVFSYRMGACPGLPMAKNEAGLTMMVNMVETTVSAPLTTPRFVRVREALARCQTAEGAYEILFEGGVFPFSLNLLIGDKCKIIGAQILPEAIRPSYVKKSIVHSNGFDYQDWVPTLRKPSYSAERHRYSEQRLAELYRENNGITDSDLLDILRDSPTICRDQKLEKSETISFMTRGSFGIGTAKGPIGQIPI